MRRFLRRFLPPVYPPVPPDGGVHPPRHEPRYHETATRAANAKARMWLVERQLRAASADGITRELDRLLYGDGEGRDGPA